MSNNSALRNKSVPLSSLSMDKKSTSGRCPGAGDSQEEILKSDEAQFVLVKHDVVSSTAQPPFASLYSGVPARVR